MNNLISVVICTHNRAKSLFKTLDSLFHQKNSGAFDYEVIVVDNNSQDDTRKIAESFASQYQGKLKDVFEPMQGKPYALNRGIREAKGGIIAFTADDVIVERGWIEMINDCFQKYACDGVGGMVLPLYPSETPSWIRENPHELAGVVVLCDLGKETKSFRLEMGKLIGANFAFRKDVFEKSGYFRTDLIFGKAAIGEDVEF